MADEKKINYLPEEEKEFIAWIDRQVREHPVVKQHHGKWKELIAWVNGEQFTEWDQESGRVAPVPLRKRKKKVVINIMKPLEEAIVGKLNLIYQLAGVPNSGEMKDMEGSKVATKCLAHNDYVNNVEEKLEDAKYDLVTTGNTFIKWHFTDLRNGWIKSGDGKKDTKDPGEVVMEVPSVFNIRPDPVAKKIEDARWFIEIAEASEDDIIEKYELKKSEIEDLGEESSASKYAGMHEPELEKDREEKTHIVRYYWERQSSKFPEGRHIIVVNNKILFKGKSPALGELPYFHIGFKRNANSFWYSGPMHHVQPIQQNLNRTVSIWSEHIEGWRAKMVVPKGAVLRAGAYTTDSFELLEVDESKGRLYPLNTPELSPQLIAFVDLMMNAKDIVSNVHEVSYSQLPKYASRAPATLFSMMLEQENLKIDPMIKRINATLRKMGSFRLRLMDKYYKRERLVKIVGEGEKSSVEYFSGADLKGNFDVKLVVGANLHQSQAVVQRLLVELKQMGAPIDWNKIFKLLQYGDIAEELRGDLADEAKAIRENQSYTNDKYDKELKDGGVYVYVHDDHRVHLDYHTNLAKTEEAEQWELDKRTHLETHITQHWQFFQQEMAMRTQVQQQATAGAGGGGAGGGVSPAREPGAGKPGPIEEGAGQSPEVAMQRQSMVT